MAAVKVWVSTEYPVGCPGSTITTSTLARQRLGSRTCRAPALALDCAVPASWDVPPVLARCSSVPCFSLSPLPWLPIIPFLCPSTHSSAHVKPLSHRLLPQYDTISLCARTRWLLFSSAGSGNTIVRHPRLFKRFKRTCPRSDEVWMRCSKQRRHPRSRTTGQAAKPFRHARSDLGTVHRATLRRILYSTIGPSRAAVAGSHFVGLRRRNPAHSMSKSSR
ncbi:hypothetical protein FKP32DRAFT_225425 [Trametes sanguinea]|nr:hypothetical protein FKP32DRAFT_225425 [Trametes sanguinea]